MSRNYELLKRAQTLVRDPALFAAASAAAAAPEEPVHYHTPDGSALTGMDLCFAAKLPTSSLQTTEKREFSKLVNSIFAPLQRSVRMLLVAGVDRRTGPAWITACAAELLSRQVGEKVCVIDADFEQGQMRDIFNVAADQGFLDALVSDEPITGYCQRLTDNLWVLPSGSAITDQNLPSAVAIKRRVDQLRRHFGYCLMAGPTISDSAEALALAQLTDGVLLVVEANATRRDIAVAAKDRLTTTGVPILGAVLNNRTFPIPDNLYSRL